MIDKSTSANLDRIFDEMYNLISAASRIPLTDKIIVEESDLAEILDDLKDSPRGKKRCQTAGRTEGYRKQGA